jgi:hypothetical protein
MPARQRSLSSASLSQARLHALGAEDAHALFHRVAQASRSVATRSPAVLAGQQGQRPRRSPRPAGARGVHRRPPLARSAAASLARHAAEDHDLGQRVRAEPVGAVDADAGTFAAGEQPGSEVSVPKRCRPMPPIV